MRCRFFLKKKHNTKIGSDFFKKDFLLLENFKFFKILRSSKELWFFFQEKRVEVPCLDEKIMKCL